MARTTQAQLDGMLAQVRTAAQQAGIPGADTWRIDHAPLYGGSAVEIRGGSATLGEAAMDANRMPPRYLYQALRMILDVLELVPTGSDDMLRGWVAAQVRETQEGDQA